MKKKPSITELLEFLDKVSIELQLAWEVPHLYNDSTFRIQWIHSSESNINFFLQQVNQSEWYNLTGKQLLKILIEEKADLLNFQFQLSKTIAIQIACSHYYIEKAGTLLGKAKVDEIIQMTNGIVGTSKDPLIKKPSKLKLVNKENS